MTRPIIVRSSQASEEGQSRIAAAGDSFHIYEWSGSGPDYLHVHHADDEAWHVLEGTLTFKFLDGDVKAPAGTTVFVPAGVAHAYTAHGAARYLIILTPRLRDLIAALQGAPREQHPEIMSRFDSSILE